MASFFSARFFGIRFFKVRFFGVRNLRRSSRLVLAALVLGGLTPLSVRAESNPTPSASRSFNVLLDNLPFETRALLTTCEGQGGVDLAAIHRDSIACGNGTPAAVSFDSYVTTVSDVLAASVLLGLRSALQSDARVTPDMLAALLQSPEGSEAVQNATASAIVQSGLVAENSSASVALLTGEVTQKLLPTLQQTDNLQTLLGTSEQYNRVVQNFCTPSDASLAQAQQSLPELSSVQIYAICIQESGLVDRALQPPKSAQ